MTRGTKNVGLSLTAVALSGMSIATANPRAAQAHFDCDDMTNCTLPTLTQKDHCEEEGDDQGFCWAVCSEGGSIVCTFS